MAQLYGKKTSDGKSKALECDDDGALKHLAEIKAAVEALSALVSGGKLQVDTELSTPTGMATESKQDVGNASLSSIDGQMSDERLRDHDQIVMTGSAIQFSATSKIYKRLVISLGQDAANSIYIGNAGVTTTDGFSVPDIGSIELLNVDIAKLYAIGTNGATEILTWVGEY